MNRIDISLYINHLILDWFPIKKDVPSGRPIWTSIVVRRKLPRELSGLILSKPTVERLFVLLVVVVYEYLSQKIGIM